MVSTITLRTKTDSFSHASSIMETAADALKKHSDICSYDSYRISPDYRYNNGKRFDDGFTGYLNSKCTFTDIKPYNKLLNDIDNLPDSVTPAVSPIIWTVKSDRIGTVRTQLKVDLIKEVYSMIPAYSSVTDRKCSLSSIDYSQGNYGSPEPVMFRAEAKIDMSAPDKSDKIVSVSADIELICK